MKHLRTVGAAAASLVLVAVCVLGTGAPAYATHDGPGGHDHPHGGPDGFDRPHGPPPAGGPHGPLPMEGFGLLGPDADRLGLSEETRAQVRSMVEASRAEGEELRKKSDEARAEMHRLLSLPDTDEATVMRQADVIGALELAEHKSRLRAMLRIRALLTPEQRKELVAIREEMFTKVFENTREACHDDIASLCPQQSGDAATRECMRRRRSDLSPGCREAIAAELAKRKPPRP